MLNSLLLQGNVACEHKNITSGALFTLCSQAKGNEKTELSECLIKLSKLLSTFEIIYLEFQKLLVISK